MAGLGILLYGALRAAVGIGNKIENARYMSQPYNYTDDGTPMYMDKDRNIYINGERVIDKLEKKSDGQLHKVRVGARTGKVYSDPYQSRIDKQMERYNEEKQKAIDKGKTTFWIHDHDYGRITVIEISTGQIIFQIRGKLDGTYWKYYARPKSRPYIFLPSETPVQITQEEYDLIERENGFMVDPVDLNRNDYTFTSKCKYEKIRRRATPHVAKEDLPKVPGR